VSGPEEAPLLVLLPGANATSLMWIPNIEALSESYRTYAVDNIYDFGRSVFTRPLKTPEDFVRWLDELFDALDLKDRINLMGLSYGGWLTSQYGLRFPDRLDKIVLVAPAATVLPLNSEFALHALIGLIPNRRFVKKTMSWALEDFFRSDEADPEMIDFFVENMYQGLRCFKFKMLVSPTVLTDQELQNLNLPTLFLVGENEKIYSAQEAIQRLNRVAPHIKTELIPGAGHDLTVVQAEMVNRIILDFLNQ
jgi:pimeloyl-ACP methyl ester carboxylesterase